MLEAVEEMQSAVGYDVVIVCCSNLSAEKFWQARLEATISEVTGVSSTVVVAVHEDWDGGAGNGLGTLYAYHKACAQASARGIDLAAKLRAGASVALYHTAGKGTRMAPLPGAENNNKPGVKLPSLLRVGDAFRPLTVLEAVMRQTSTYARVRGGRVSVFWGDQVFVPSAGVKATTHAADIMAALRPMPTQEEWEAGQLHQYGLIAVDAKGDAMQLEKVTYETAKAYLPEDVQQVGTSLGSFSMSAALVEALLAEFEAELAAKKGSLDSDPHFWMPLTLKRADYVTVMCKKGTDEAVSGAHFDRMQAFRGKFQPEGSLLGCVDVGSAALWWDYGRLELYMRNNLHVAEDNASAEALRAFLRLGKEGRQQHNTIDRKTQVDPSAVVLNCNLGGGRVGAGCVLVNVTAPTVDVEGAVLVNVTSTAPVVGKGGLVYNAVHEEAGTLAADEVRADVFMPGQHVTMRSRLDVDSGKVWKQQLDGNSASFEGIYKANQPLDVAECQAECAAAHAAAAAKLLS